MKKIILIGIVLLLCGCKKENIDRNFVIVDGEFQNTFDDEGYTTEEKIKIDPKEIFDALGSTYKRYEVVQNEPLIVKVSASTETNENSSNAYSFFTRNGLAVQYNGDWYEIVIPSVYKTGGSIFFDYTTFRYYDEYNIKRAAIAVEWTSIYDTDGVNEEKIESEWVIRNDFERVTMDWISYKTDGITTNMKYKILEGNIGYEVIGYAMLGEDFGIKYSFKEYMSDGSQINIPDLVSEEVLKTLCLVRKYK